MNRVSDRFDLEIGADQMAGYSDMESIGPNKEVDLVVFVSLASLVAHLDALWLGVSGPADGELIVAAGLEVHVCPLI